MRWAKHRHHYRLWRGNPDGYLFHCKRCEKTGLYPFKFVRLTDFWGQS